MREYGRHPFGPLTNNKEFNSESCQQMKVRLFRLAFRVFQNAHFLAVALLALAVLLPAVATAPPNSAPLLVAIADVHQ